MNVNFLRLAMIAWAAILLLGGCDRTVPPKAEQSQPDELPAAASPLAVVEQADANPADNAQAVVDPALNLQAPDQARTDPAEPAVQRKLIAVSRVKSDDPSVMVQHLSELDRSMQDLLIAASRMDEQAAKEAAIELARMKLEAGEHLAGLPAATAPQIKQGTQAQLVALSHLSGLKDVQAAKRLEEFAAGLLNHPDIELRHQGQIVQFGFAIQSLQNGVLTDPAPLLQAARELIAEPDFRTRLEMTSLAHAAAVLQQMGFAADARQLGQSIFDDFSQSSDLQLRNEAWNQLTIDSQAVENFLTSLQALGSPRFEPAPVLAAARGLIQEYPNPVTLEMIAGIVTNIEYSGNVALSSDLSRLIESEIGNHPSGVSTAAVQAILDEHQQRVGWLGQPMNLDDLTDQQGQPLDPAIYAGKVYLVDFWATWCAPCLKEIPNIQKAYEELSSQGFEVLSINMDQDASQLKRYLEANRLPWTTYRCSADDSRGLTDRFGITLFPHTLLVDRDGKVASLHVRGENILTSARQLLAP